MAKKKSSKASGDTPETKVVEQPDKEPAVPLGERVVLPSPWKGMSQEEIKKADKTLEKTMAWPGKPLRDAALTEQVQVLRKRDKKSPHIWHQLQVSEIEEAIGVARAKKKEAGKQGNQQEILEQIRDGSPIRSQPEDKVAADPKVAADLRIPEKYKGVKLTAGDIKELRQLDALEAKMSQVNGPAKIVVVDDGFEAMLNKLLPIINETAGYLAPPEVDGADPTLNKNGKPKGGGFGQDNAALAAAITLLCYSARKNPEGETLDLNSLARLAHSTTSMPDARKVETFFEAAASAWKVTNVHPDGRKVLTNLADMIGRGSQVGAFLLTGTLVKRLPDGNNALNPKDILIYKGTLPKVDEIEQLRAAAPPRKKPATPRAPIESGKNINSEAKVSER